MSATEPVSRWARPCHCRMCYGWWANDNMVVRIHEYCVFLLHEYYEFQMREYCVVWLHEYCVVWLHDDRACRMRLPARMDAPTSRSNSSPGSIIRRTPLDGEKLHDRREKANVLIPVYQLEGALACPDPVCRVAIDSLRSAVKNFVTSSANSSGCSIAAKCPPRSISVQWTML